MTFIFLEMWLLEKRKKKILMWFIILKCHLGDPGRIKSHILQLLNTAFIKKKKSKSSKLDVNTVYFFLLLELFL